MKQILTILTVLSIGVSASFAGCGKTVTDKGKLKSFDKETKAVVVSVGGKDVKRTLTPTATGAGEIDKLVGQAVTVVSSHDKVQSIVKG